MATKSTKSTWVVLAAIAIAIFAAWKLIPAFASKLGSGSGQSSSGVGGGGFTEDDENPYGYNTGQSPLQSLLSSLGSLFGGKSGGGGSGSGGGSNGGFGSGSSPAGSPGVSAIGGDLSEAYSSPYALSSILSDLGLDAGSPDSYASNSELGGDTLYGYSGDNSGGLAGYQIPYENADQQLTLVPTASGLQGDDSSASDAVISNGGYADTTSYTTDGGVGSDGGDVASNDGGDYPGDDSGDDGSYDSGD